MTATDKTPSAPEAINRAPVDLLLLWLLAALAGAVDARGVVLLHDVFLSFMSGNSTMLAVNLALANWPKAMLIGLIVGVFVLGAAIGQVAAEFSGRWRLPTVVALVTVLLTLPLVLPAPGTAVSMLGGRIIEPSAAALAMTFAMGALNAGMQHAGSATVSITFVTGALVRFGQGLGTLLVGRTGDFLWLAQAVPWTGLVSGATLAALGSVDYGSAVAVILPVFAGVLTALTALAARRPG